MTKYDFDAIGNFKAINELGEEYIQVSMIGFFSQEHADLDWEMGTLQQNLFKEISAEKRQLDIKLDVKKDVVKSGLTAQIGYLLVILISVFLFYQNEDAIMLYFLLKMGVKKWDEQKKVKGRKNAKLAKKKK